MLLETPQVINTDVLVIGGGGAGLRAAIEARKKQREVLVVSQSRGGYGNNTAISMGMFSASGGKREPADSPEAHLRDTIAAGRFINSQGLVEVMAKGAWQQVVELEAAGVAFKKSGNEMWIMAVPGHSYARNVGATRTLGAEFSVPLRRQASQLGVRFLEGVLVATLLVKDGEAFGALALDANGDLYVLQGGATVLATGGAGEVYLRTNNASGSTGDGFALAFESGLPLVDMEFVQFYPTTVGRFGGRVWLYEMILGRGATLRNYQGEDVLERHNLRDFMAMTRDMLARAIMTEILEGRDVDGGLVPDLSTVPPEKLPKVQQVIREQRYAEKVIVAPAAHHFMGGVVINRNCETWLNRLFAAGEVCGGIHGANRLAGNAITDILVFGSIAGQEAAMTADIKLQKNETAAKEQVDRLKELAKQKGQENAENLRQVLRETMWRKAGIIRNQKGLEEALSTVKTVQERLARVTVDSPPALIKLLKLRNMSRVSEMVCRAALLRTESRGSHYRTDFPEENNKDWLKNITIMKKDARMELTTKPVAFTRFSPQ